MTFAGDMLQGSHFPNLPHNTSISRSHVSDLWLLPGMRHIMDHRMMGGKQAHAGGRQTDRRTSEHGAALQGMQQPASASMMLTSPYYSEEIEGGREREEMDIMHACGTIGTETQGPSFV